MTKDKDKFDYFMERTEKDLDEIKVKLEKLWEFRALLLGGTMVLSGLVTFVLNLIFIYLEHK